MQSRKLITRLLNVLHSHGQGVQRPQRMYCGREHSFTGQCTCFHKNHLKSQGPLDLSKRIRHFHRTAYGQTTNGSVDGKDAAINDDSAKRESYLEARRKGVLKGRRRLSPFERVGGMILEGNEVTSETGDHIHPRDCKNASSKDSKDLAADETNSYEQSDEVGHSETSGGDQSNMDERNKVNITHQSSEPPIVDGEFIIITRENLKRQEKLVRLIKLDPRQEFKCKFGSIDHADIIGHQNGSIFITDMGIELLIRRPSLDEFVLYMKRHPVIAYPKDCCTMLMMIDVSPGDVVLEAGSGSGAMTLFLSRAVGHHGQVLSFEKVQTHQTRAEKNFRLWHKSYDISHPTKWPQNVSFFPCRLQDCGKFIKDAQVDGAIIDMEEPSRVMATMSQRLKSGKAMAIYVANLSQVIDLAEVIRQERLPLVMEKTLEVMHKEWVVNPARRYHGVVLQEPTAVDGEEFSSEGLVGKSKGVQYIADEVPKYITRPHHMQLSHTAFLVKIRKTQTPSSTFKV